VRSGRRDWGGPASWAGTDADQYARSVTDL
jgi:hypothetical protein